MRGDLIFCSSTGDLVGRVVQWGEHLLGASPPAATIVHVGVETGNSDDGRIVAVTEAVWPRVRRGRYDLIADAHVQRVAWALRYPQPRRDRALAWLDGQMADEYGWSDVLTNAAHLLGVPVSLFQQHGFDCSHLTFTYMSLAGEDWAGSGFPGAADWVANPQEVTPANLYAYAQAHPGLRAPRKPDDA